MGRKAGIFIDYRPAGILEEITPGKKYQFIYGYEYKGDGISLTMPSTKREYVFEGFPPFFEGLLPEGYQLKALLKKESISEKDLFSQLLAVGSDLVGNITVQEIS